MAGFNLIRINIVIKMKITKKLRKKFKLKVGKRHSKTLLNSKRVNSPRIFWARRRLKAGKIKKPSSIKARQSSEPKSESKTTAKSPSMPSLSWSLPFAASSLFNLDSVPRRFSRSHIFWLTLRTQLISLMKSSSLRAFRCLIRLNTTYSGKVWGYFLRFLKHKIYSSIKFWILRQISC